MSKRRKAPDKFFIKQDRSCQILSWYLLINSVNTCAQILRQVKRRKFEYLICEAAKMMRIAGCKHQIRCTTYGIEHSADYICQMLSLLTVKQTTACRFMSINLFTFYVVLISNFS